jgi:hypothetical protein
MDVVIRIKSHPTVQASAVPLPAGDPSQPPRNLPPGSWQGPPPGQAPPISAAASGLVGYTSVNGTRTVEGQPEEPQDEALLALRGTAKQDDLVHAMISWTTLETYPLRVGVSLPVLNQAQIDGEEMFHEAQLWEQTEEEWVISENHADFVYNWLSGRLKARSTSHMPPMGMPESVNEMAVQTSRDGDFGYILFTPEESLHEPMKKMDVQVVIEYDDGRMKVEMGEAYTIRMLVEEFWYLTHHTWEFGPVLPVRRLTDGTVVHGITWEWKELQALMNKDEKVKLPLMNKEDRGRGALIRSLTSQGKLLQYWPRTETNIEVGMFLPEESNGVQRNIEYWMNLTLQWVPNARPEHYPGFFRDMCIQRTKMISNGVAQWLSGIDDFRVETRDAFNTVRVWYCPLAAYGVRVKWPMAEDPAPKDKWYAGSGIMAYTFPLTEEVHEEPSILFGPGSVLQERYDDEEV